MSSSPASLPTSSPGPVEAAAAAPAAALPRRKAAHPVLIMLGLMMVAILLTHLVPAGKFDRVDKRVVAGSYRQVEKINGVPALLATRPPAADDAPARASGVVALFTSITEGVANSSSLIFMVLFVGGMFGVIQATGAFDAGIDRLLHLTSGNIYVLTAGLMLLLACGSSFLGFISEYIAIVPVVAIAGRRLGLPDLFAPAVVGVGAKIGYAASVSNPVALAVAQPLAGVPVFSGLDIRLAIFTVMMVIGVGYVLLYLRRLPKRAVDIGFDAAPLTRHQSAVLLGLLAGAVFLLVGARVWSWHSNEMAAVFIALSVVLAAAGGLRPGAAADAFIDGMKIMLLPALLIGLAGAVAVILQSSQVLDSIVEGLASVISGYVPGVVAMALMTAEMALDLTVPSLAAKAMVSLPILTPIAQLNGVSGQVTVTALLLGSGLNHLVSPTSPVLLALLAVSKVPYGEWLRFVVPLWAMLCVVGYGALLVMTMMGS